jgi:G3E family GTPase
MTGAAPIPVSVVTGFLGAGKSTLLNKLLCEPELADTLVIVNEWGEIGLDHLLIEKIEGDVILLSAGCLCCQLRGDLVEALRDLYARRDKGEIAPFARVVIETSGLADPTSILHAIVADPQLGARYRLAGMITLVDAVNGAETLMSFKEAARQIALADRLAITKSDLLEISDRSARLAALRESLAALNPGAPIFDIAAGEFRAADLVALDPFDVAVAGDRRAATRVQTEHKTSIRAHSLRLQDPIGAPAFAMFLAHLRTVLGPRLLRIKGLIALAEHPAEPLVIHGVQHVFHPPRRLKSWPDADHSTRLVLIVDGLERASVDRILAALSGAPAIDTPDLEALVRNPLAPALGGLLA